MAVRHLADFALSGQLTLRTNATHLRHSEQLLGIQFNRSRSSTERPALPPISSAKRYHEIGVPHRERPPERYPIKCPPPSHPAQRKPVPEQNLIARSLSALPMPSRWQGKTCVILRRPSPTSPRAG